MSVTPCSSIQVVRGSTPRAAAPAAIVGVLLVVVAASMPLWAESSWMREFVEIACYFIFAMMWNLLAGYGGMVSIGQQAFFGLGGYVMLMLGNFAGVNPFVAVPLAALGAAAGRGAGVVRRVPAAGRLLRDRHLGHRRGVPARVFANVSVRRRRLRAPA